MYNTLGRDGSEGDGQSEIAPKNKGNFVTDKCSRSWRCKVKWSIKAGWMNSLEPGNWVSASVSWPARYRHHVYIISRRNEEVGAAGEKVRLGAVSSAFRKPNFFTREHRVIGSGCIPSDQIKCKMLAHALQLPRDVPHRFTPTTTRNNRRLFGTSLHLSGTIHGESFMSLFLCIEEIRLRYCHTAPESVKKVTGSRGRDIVRDPQPSTSFRQLC